MPESIATADAFARPRRLPPLAAKWPRFMLLSADQPDAGFTSGCPETSPQPLKERLFFV
jgi:hypothetical protein